MQKTAVLSFAAALLFLAGCQVDATKFSCSTSAECPTGYHCDMGTATTAGTFKCASGGPQQKTLTADATKFLLLKAPSPDGTVRTTITAAAGAVTATPDFVGVRAIASQGGVDLADAQVLNNGSVLAFQLPQATAQVSLRVQDDSGHSIPVTGYSEEIELSFVGKEVAGNSNPAAAYDVTTSSDSLYPPATWITSGPGPDGGVPPEFALTDTLFADGGVQSASSYSSLAYTDYREATTPVPTRPLDPSGISQGTPAGWQEFAQLATSQNPDGGPPARVGGTFSGVNGAVLYGGTDAAGNAVDRAGTFYRFDSFNGWTLNSPSAGGTQVPSGNAIAGVALGVGGGTPCPGYPCTQDVLQFSMAGGFTNASGNMTNRVVAFGTRLNYSNTGVLTSQTQGWFDVGNLSFNNAGMASAPAQVPISNSPSTGTSENFAGMLLVGGQAITNQATNDANGCVLYAGYPNFTTSGVKNNTLPCSDPNGSFVTATGGIGFRTGATVVPIDQSTFLLFGGNKTLGNAGNGFKSDLWQGKLACNVIAPATACTTQVTWTQLPQAGTPPTPRINAAGAIWETTFTFTPTFTVNRKLLIYGGTDGTGATVNDMWEYDLTAATWRQVRIDGGAALVPAVRSRPMMAGDGSHAYLFGGLISGAATDQTWLATREGVARLLMKAPLGLPSIDTATNMKITVDAAGLAAPSSFSTSQAFLWDGSKWRFVGTGASDAAGNHLLISPTSPGTAFVQPDGNIYLLLMQTDRAGPQFGGSEVGVDRLRMIVDFK